MKVLYGIKEQDIEDTRAWEEGRLTIDIEKRIINFNVLHKYSDLQELIEDYEINKDEIKEININFTDIKFENVFDLKCFIDKSNYNEQHYFHNNYDNSYISLIQ